VGSRAFITAVKDILIGCAIIEMAKFPKYGYIKVLEPIILHG
jgi:hypothetical protein